MFTKTARFYDKIYASKDYAAEVERIVAIVRQDLRPGGRQLLDVVCGTGHHVTNWDYSRQTRCRPRLKAPGWT